MLNVCFPCLESWALASCVTNFELVGKTATLSALVTTKCCSDLTLLHINDQHLFLQHHVAIFFLYLVVRWINMIIFHPKFTLNLIPVLIFAPNLFEGLFIVY